MSVAGALDEGGLSTNFGGGEIVSLAGRIVLLSNASDTTGLVRTRLGCVSITAAYANCVRASKAAE